jgi:hypothetical protein
VAAAGRGGATIVVDGAIFRRRFFCTVFFGAGALRLADRFAVGRLAERRFGAFRIDLADLVPPAAFRLAMDESFQNLDSSAISVVLSAAYRNLQKARGEPDPLQPAGTFPVRSPVSN